MTPFIYTRAGSASAAIEAAGTGDRAKYLGGGTNLVDLMREGIEHPDVLVDVTGLSDVIDARPDGGALIGAAATNTALATNRMIRQRFPLLARAVLSGASGQIRNMATVGGNLLQRTRCVYFYDGSARCNKRRPGAGCDAIHGLNRAHAVLGASSACAATHPSDMAVALVALEAVVHLRGPDGIRTIPVADLHRLPGDHPEIETALAPRELITAVEVPALSFGFRSTYRKVRDRASFAFALVSVAAALDLDEDGTVRDVRLALGGVAPKPWRALAAENVLRGRPASEAWVLAAAEAELAGAVPLAGNAFKIELVRRTIIAAVANIAGDR